MKSFSMQRTVIAAAFVGCGAAIFFGLQRDVRSEPIALRPAAVNVRVSPVATDLDPTQVALLHLNLQQAAAPKNAAAEDRFQEFVNCIACHYAPTPRVQPAFVKLDESKNWLAHDKHARAFRSLETPRGKQMGELLQKQLNWPDAVVTTKFECLSCHVNATKDFSPDPKTLTLGVGCHSCHGTATGYIALHAGIIPRDPQDNKTWREKTPEERMKLGFVNVREPVARAEQCLKCHIGDANEGKILTHEMYAAGHPPLPSIEVETYLDQMPAHWQPVRDKSPEFQTILGVKPTEFDRTKSVLIGAVLSLRQTLGLVAHQMNAETRVAGTSWPDFAQFNCYECHHELQIPSWRQLRGYKHAPGRPQLPSWTMALLESQALEAIEDPQLAEAWGNAKSHLVDLAKAFGKQPFGDPGLIGTLQDKQSASRLAIDSLTTTAERLAAHSYTSKEVSQVLTRLATAASSHFPDYESARQFAWASQMIVKDLGPTEVEKVSKELTSLNDILSLTLPKTLPWTIPVEQFSMIHQAVAPPSGIEEALPQVLTNIGAYDPRGFRETMLKVKVKLTGVPDPAELRTTTQSAPAAPTIVAEN